MTVIYADENESIREDVMETGIDFYQGWIEFNGKEINIENVIRIEE